MTASTLSPLHTQAQALSRMAYSDVNALRQISGNDPAALEQAAAQFESLFVDIWLQSMREANKAFSEGSYLSSSSVEMHQEMLDHQLAVHVSEAGGVGLKDVLMRQLAGRVDAVEQQPSGGIVSGGSTSGGSDLLIANSSRQIEAPRNSRSGDRSHIAPESGGFKQALFDGAESFVRSLEPLVRRIAGASGIHPVAVLAQAALETGWGSKVPHDADGQPSYNLFGVKAHGWEGPSVDVTTLEHQFDRFVRKVDSFRAYEGIAEAVKDYVAFLSGNQRYAGALDVAQDPPAFADALQEAGYATDPAYADKLKALQRQIAAMLGVSWES